MLLLFFFLFFPFSVSRLRWVRLLTPKQCHQHGTHCIETTAVCCFEWKISTKNILLPTRWIEKYGQTEINLSLTIKFWPLQCKIIYISILPSIELHSYFSAFTPIERERLKFFWRIYIFSSNNFTWKSNTRNYFPSYFSEGNQTTKKFFLFPKNFFSWKYFILKKHFTSSQTQYT